MPAVAPFTVADTASAAKWLDHVAEAYAPGPATLAEADATARRLIDQLQARDVITCAVATLLLQIFDLAPLDLA